MLKTLPLEPSVRREKNEPSKIVLDSILNYSKSLEIKTIKKQKILIHLN